MKLHGVRLISRALLVVLLVSIHGGCVTGPAVVGPWQREILYQSPGWAESDLAPEPGLTGLLYEGLPYQAKRVQVFAYLGLPEGTPPAGGWPAVVCVHGGGGTAFAPWVREWNRRGFAAISMDLEGHIPVHVDPSDRRSARLPSPFPGPERVGVFNDFAEPMVDQWYYHAVSQVVLAHSLLRAMPAVNPEKIGITGISWGGTLTSTTIGVDDRFKFAVPVYGCGFLPDSDGIQGKAIKPGAHSDFVWKNYDGSAFFARANLPVLWVNGTNDAHFPMPSTQASARAVAGESTFRYELGMKHGHGPGWAPEEIYAFAASVVGDAPSLVKFERPELLPNAASVTIHSARNIPNAAFFYTTESGDWPGRTWHEAPAERADRSLRAPIPDGTVAWFFTATDDRGLMTSSEFYLMP